MWKQAHSRQEEEDVNVNSQTASAAKERVCHWDWLCKAGLYHPPAALAARASSFPLPTCVTQTFSCLFRVRATALVASPEERERPVPPNAVALSYLLLCSIRSGRSILQEIMPFIQDIIDFWGQGPQYHTAGDTEHLVTGATAGPCENRYKLRSCFQL